MRACVSLIVVRKNVVEHGLKIVGQRRLEGHFPPVRRMMKHESACMQKRTFEGEHRTQIARHPSMDAAIEGVADDGMSDSAEMYADLMRATGGDGDVQQRHARQMKSFGNPGGRGAGAACLG